MNKPFLLKPTGKDYLWGGRRLIEDFCKEFKSTNVAESWECSTHSDGSSLIASGEFKNELLSTIINLHPDFLGNCIKNDDLPIMVKLIDAENDLSVQVHPNDDYASEKENGQMGKTEMWYVLDADQNASIIYGLSKDMTREQLKDAALNGNLERFLKRVPIKKDDVFFVEAGTIHAICAGALIAEVQESSNLTYRLYDYNRKDKSGNKRELHIDKALEVCNLKKSEDPIQPMRVLNYRPGCAVELLARCRYFEVSRMIVNTERCKSFVGFQAHETYRILLCYKGCGSIVINENEAIPFFKGDCVFFPANSVEVKLHGFGEFLDIKG